MLWRSGSLFSDEDAVFTVVQMRVDVCVTRMEEPNNENSIKQWLLKLLFKFVFPFCFTQLL